MIKAENFAYYLKFFHPKAYIIGSYSINNILTFLLMDIIH